MMTLERINSLIRRFAVTGWKRWLYAFIFILLCWQLTRFWGNWKEGASSVFYYIHAPVHEIGHTVTGMMCLPEVIVVLAGSIFQLLTPIAIGVYFVWHGDHPALSLCLGWLGFATIEMATYMYDAPFGNRRWWPLSPAAMTSSTTLNTSSRGGIALETPAASARSLPPSATFSSSPHSFSSSPCSLWAFCHRIIRKREAELAHLHATRGRELAHLHVTNY
ncbi:MAG: hypothetical protein IKR81_15315 [Victivallales bacterium]|nr:hypothetical protein [Victivallales bacterium]